MYKAGCGSKYSVPRGWARPCVWTDLGTGCGELWLALRGFVPYMH